MTDKWEETDDRSHTACFENVSFGTRITDQGTEPGIRIALHEHVGTLIALTEDGAEVSLAVEDLWIIMHPTHAYDLLIGLLRATSDADDERQIDWSSYRWPLPPGRIIQAMMALAYSMYDDFDPEQPNDPPDREVHNDPHNS